MTDGVARLLDRYADEEDQARLLPHIYTDQLEALYTGAMFLTEKAGGSDVGANLVRAEQIEGNMYRLNGEKWFCSNANAELIFALARTNEDVPGTRGLSIFLIEKYLPDGSRNAMDFIRLKDKLGVRSMASAEIVLTDTIGKRVGEEGQGFKIMADMVNLSRIYNATASIAFMRRALAEAYQFVVNRITFGKKLIEHALVRTKLHELGSLYVANFYLTWHAIRVLDRADNGDQEAQQLIRLLTPMVKKYTAETGVYLVRECMELMGGIGYIEDGVMPKLMRDMMVLPIWEGAGNIMVLDMLRALVKSDGLDVMLEGIQKQLKGTAYQGLLDELLALLKELPKLEREDQEATAKPFFERLTQLYMVGLLNQYRDEESQQWINPALDYWANQLIDPAMKIIKVPSRERVAALMAWRMG
jgi:acyl-CoA dehydrogenase